MLFFSVPPLSMACSEGALPSNPVARFELAGDALPNFLDVPFPSDIYVQNTHIIDPVPGVDAVVRLNPQFVTHELAKSNGFSRIAMSLFYVDDPTQPVDADNPTLGHPTAIVDAKTLPADETACTEDTSSVFLLDLQATDPAKARIPCRAMFRYDDPATSLATSRDALGVGPARGIVLDEGHTYAAVLTSRVEDTTGRRVLASDDFASIANGNRSGANRAMYGGAIDKAKSLLAGSLATDGAAIVAIAPYTTSHQSSELYQARAIIDGTAAPVLKFDAASLAPMGVAKFAAKIAGSLPSGFTASLDDYFGVVDAGEKLPDGTDDPDDQLPVRAHDQIAALGTGEFDAVGFLTHPADFSDTDGATFVKDGTGNIERSPDAPVEKIWATIALPTASMPASGYPVVIVQHGLASWRGYAFTLANTFCKHGWAVVAIDSYPFGSRAPEPEFQHDTDTDYEGAPGATYKGPDGIGDPSNGTHNGAFDFFGGLKNMGALRDQLRQAALDTTELVRMIRNSPDLSFLQTGAAVPKFDGDKIAYIGDSLGAIEGAVAAAIEPNVKAWTLNVGGGGVLQEVATHGPSIGFQLAAAGGLFFGLNGDTYDEAHPLVVLGQTLIDAGDPLTFAKFLVTSPQPVGGLAPPRNILQTEVIYDELVANEGGEALARAAGYGLAVPNIGSNAGVLDVKDLSHRSGAVPLTDVQPDASGNIHDTPISGTTAVVVQISPAAHGEDLVSSSAKRQWAIPFTHPFSQLDTDKQYSVRTSYRAIQATAASFFADAFAGEAPKVAGFTPPIRDVDDDGAADDVDADPNNPQVK
ncbi:MAG: hypothetical protein ACRELY_01860 [Polyangiaceae bacterium]